MGFGLLICVVPLYWAKTKADSMRDNMQQLSREVAEEQKQVAALEAKYATLNRFNRLESAATELGLKPISGSQISNLSELDRVAPIKRHDSDNSGSVIANDGDNTQISNDKGSSE